ncbi:hypothetical protein HK102_007455, partial [Quaeritorhiza haematococci]
TAKAPVDNDDSNNRLLDRPREFIYLYPEDNYVGEVVVRGAGFGCQNVPARINDHVRSFKIYGNYCYTVFEHENCGGASLEFCEDVPVLWQSAWGWEWKISSGMLSFWRYQNVY